MDPLYYYFISLSPVSKVPPEKQSQREKCPKATLCIVVLMTFTVHLT